MDSEKRKRHEKRTEFWNSRYRLTLEGAIMHPKVVVVGAGVSGLSAANRLCSSGMCDVTILEAENRIGGRIHTVDFHEKKIELGAQWIHGTEGNSVSQLLAEEIYPKKFSYEDESDSEEEIDIVFASGRTPSKEICKLFDKANDGIAADIEAEVSHRIENLQIPRDELESVTLLSVAREVWERDYISSFENENLDRADTNAVFDNILKMMSIVDGDSADKIGCLLYHSYREFPGGDAIIPGSFSVLLNHLKRPIPDSAIKLKTKVKTINWDFQRNGVAKTQNGSQSVAKSLPCGNHSVTKNGVTVTHNGSRVEQAFTSEHQNGAQCETQSDAKNQLLCKNHNTVTKNGATRAHDECPLEVQYANENGNILSLYADHVIITVSLGCLQKYHKTLFIPNLALEKQIALEKMGFGTVNKVILFYNKKFWHDGGFTMYFLWDSYRGGDVFADETHWCRQLHEIYSFQDHILITWVNETASKMISHLSNAEIANTVAELMRKFNPGVPDPDDVIVTKWGENENFLGSYTYNNTGIGENLASKNTVFEPLTVCGFPKVLFAGEATHSTRFSTVDGAYESGQREADRLLTYWRQESGPKVVHAEY